MLALSSLSSAGEYLILDQDTGQRVLVMLLGASTRAVAAEDVGVAARQARSEVARSEVHRFMAGPPFLVVFESVVQHDT